MISEVTRFTQYHRYIYIYIYIPPFFDVQFFVAECSMRTFQERSRELKTSMKMRFDHSFVIIIDTKSVANVMENTTNE